MISVGLTITEYTLTVTVSATTILVFLLVIIGTLLCVQQWNQETINPTERASVPPKYAVQESSKQCFDSFVPDPGTNIKRFDTMD